MTSGIVNNPWQHIGAPSVVETTPVSVASPVIFELTATEAAATKALSSTDGNFVVNSRDGLGRTTSFTDNSGTTYTVTYGSFGPSTISGGGKTRTYAYNAAGQITGYSAS